MKLTAVTSKKAKLFYVSLVAAYLMAFAAAPLYFYPRFYNVAAINNLYTGLSYFHRGLGRWAFYTSGNGDYYYKAFTYDQNSSLFKLASAAENPRLNDNLPRVLTPISNLKYKIGLINLLQLQDDNFYWICKNFNVEAETRYYYIVKDAEYDLTSDYAESDPGQLQPIDKTDRKLHVGSYSDQGKLFYTYSFICPGDANMSSAL
ncbi:MAG: hypothetical protein KDD38_09620 [Bdellovibrionales bacterium]|nr:hypothetical protein [Bdellovibrionales bacterium]